MKPLKKLLSLFLVPIALASCARSTPSRADVVLIDANTPPCPIVAEGRVKGKRVSLETRLAGELAKYLKQITGKEFPVQAANETLPERAIIIGAHGIAAPAELGPDGFVIKTQAQHLFIVGGSDQGTAYGVYGFLESQLGCRWWAWDEETVPQRAAIKLGDLDITEKPAFVLHDIWSQEAQTTKNDFLYKSRAKATVQFTGGNGTMFTYLKPFYDTHPDFLPMNDKGVRKFNNLHLNYLAPEMPELLAGAIEKDVKKRHGNITDWIYALGQGDWYHGLDQSPESKQVYADEAWTDPHGIERPGLVAPLLRMANATSEILQQEYPGIRVGIFPYMSVDSPPGKTVPGPNVDIYLPRLRYGTTLGIEEAASDLNPNAGSLKKSQMIKDSIEQWAKLAPGRMFIWEYGVNYKNFVKPWPDLRSMAENIKYYHRVGVTGVMIQANYTGTGGDLAVLKNWIWGKLLWNPDQDVDKLLKEFCDGYYGPASAEMLNYVNALEDSVRKPVYRQYDEFYDGEAYLTPEVLAKLQAALDGAEAKTKDGTNTEYYLHVREASASLDAMRLWTKDSTLVEKDGRLIRADINKANGGEYTFPRAQELIKYLRGSGITEWSHPISQERTIIPVNGGPLYTLSHGAVTAKIAPYQGYRRLWSVLFNDQRIIRHSFISIAGRYYEPVGTPSNDKVEIAGEIGYGSWDPKAYQLETDTFTQDADGTLHWDGQHKQVYKGNPVLNQPLVGTTYPAANLAAAQKYKVEVKTAAGWKAVPVKAVSGIPKMDKPEAATGFKLRITTPDKKTIVLDSYDGLAVTGYAVGFGAPYTQKAKDLLTYVQYAGVPTELGKTVPSFQRTIQFSAAS